MARYLNRPTTVKLADRTIHVADPAHRYLVTAADGTTAEGMVNRITSEPGRLDITLGELDHELNYVTEIREVGAPVTEFRLPTAPTAPGVEVYLYSPHGTTTGPYTSGDDGKWYAEGVSERGTSWANVIMLACATGATVRWYGPGLAPDND